MKMRKIKEKTLTIFGAVFGTVAGVFGFIGAMGWCCIPLVVGFFALFGITSTMFLITYSWLFLLLAVISLSLVIIPYFKKNGNKNLVYGTLTCPNCEHKEKKLIPKNRCVISYRCSGCGETIKTKKGSCCVFCSYGDIPCLSKK